jgi:hypothetical protein
MKIITRINAEKKSLNKELDKVSQHGLNGLGWSLNRHFNGKSSTNMSKNYKAICWNEL